MGLGERAMGRGDGEAARTGMEEPSPTSFRVSEKFRTMAKAWAWSHGMNLSQLVVEGARAYMEAGLADEPSPMGGPTTSTSVRIPRQLKSRAKAYATLHHMTLAQVLIRGTELLMEQGDGDSVKKR